MAHNGFPNKETVERVRKQYLQGMRVELVSMSDPYTTLKAGDLGTVNHVDDTGTVFVDWDNGSALGAVYGEDVIRRLPAVDGKIKEQILAVRGSAVTNMFDAKAVQRIAFERGFYELVDFIETDRRAYATFILTGAPSEK
jgi:hypothetical protein